MSLIGDDIYNIDQSLTNGIDDLQLNSLISNTINNIPSVTISYLDATSSIQTQLNNLALQLGTGTNFWL